MKAWPWFVGSIGFVGLAAYFGLSQRAAIQSNQAERQTAVLVAQLEEQRRVNEATLQKLKEIEERDKQTQEQRQAAEAENQHSHDEAAAEKARLDEEQKRREAQAQVDAERAQQQRAAEERARQQQAAQQELQRRADQMRQEAERQAQARGIGGTAPASNQRQTYVVPAGTKLVVSLSQNITTEQMHAGDTFEASLQEPLQVNGVDIAAKGSGVLGQIMTAQQAGRISGSSELVLQLSRLHAGTQDYPLQTADYEARGKGQGGSTVKSTVGGAAAGVLIGVLTGKGAAKGALVGGSAGLGAALVIRGEQLNIPAETILEFTLAQALSITK